MVPPLSCKVLDTFDCFSAVLRGLDDDVEPTFKLLGIVGALEQLRGRIVAHTGRRESLVRELLEADAPFEQRKLWLLNASHSLLAYAGSIRAHATIDEAIADPQCRSWVEALWDEFEAGATPEARFAKAIDRLEPMVLNWFNEGGTWRLPGANLATIRARESGVVAGSTALGDATGMLVGEGLRRGWIRDQASGGVGSGGEPTG